MFQSTKRHANMFFAFKTSGNKTMFVTIRSHNPDPKDTLSWEFSNKVASRLNKQEASDFKDHGFQIAQYLD